MVEFARFERVTMRGDGVDVYVRIGGSGPPLVLLHGYPQTGDTWAKVAPTFAQTHTVIVPDLRGYGRSDCPVPTDDHDAHSKRAMGRDVLAIMDTLGYDRFALVGHDRGARVSYRLALDHPERLMRLGILEVVPTAEMWSRFDAEMAFGAYHWTFLAQPHPLPERMIEADPVAYLDWTLASWTSANTLDPFPAVSLDAYRAMARDPARVRAWCEDYRAGYGIDRERDEADRAAGRRIRVPLHFVWSTHGFPARTGDPLGIWREWADEVTGEAIECGHFGPEENPSAVIAAFAPFLREAARTSN